MKISRRFHFQISWRLTAIVAAAGFFFYLLRDFGLGFAALLTAAIFIFSLYSLFQYIDRSNRGLARFLQAVRYHDFSLSPGIEGLGGSFIDLNAAFREISGQFQHAREEKETQYRYLQTVVQHIGVGLLSLRADGSVDLLNNVAKRLLRVSHLRNIRDLPPLFQPLVAEIQRLRPGEHFLNWNNPMKSCNWHCIPPNSNCMISSINWFRCKTSRSNWRKKKLKPGRA
jgi:two-component system nitrogen regulation sensor histidine kinase NtrY